MNSPCGHAEATCVIGNYWTCPTCDKPKTAGDYPTAVITPASIEAARASLNQFSHAAVARLASEITKKWAGVICPKLERADDAYGSHMAFIDPNTGVKATGHHNRCYADALLGPNPQEWSAAIDTACGLLAQRVEDMVEAVASARGWSRYRLATLGQLPHVVQDDGKVAVRMSTEDASIVRIRAFWIVVPQ